MRRRRPATASPGCRAGSRRMRATRLPAMSGPRPRRVAPGRARTRARAHQPGRCARSQGIAGAPGARRPDSGSPGEEEPGRAARGGVARDRRGAAPRHHAGAGVRDRAGGGVRTHLAPEGPGGGEHRRQEGGCAEFCVFGENPPARRRARDRATDTRPGQAAPAAAGVAPGGGPARGFSRDARGTPAAREAGGRQRPAPERPVPGATGRGGRVRAS